MLNMIALTVTFNILTLTLNNIVLLMRIGRIFILLCMVISILSSKEMNANTPTRPDFAYPKTVSEDADKSLARALSESDGPMILRAILDYYLAQTSINSENAQPVLNRIDSICTASADPLLKAMLLTLQADIYSAAYNASRWKYDSRNLPPTPLPTDFNEWSGEQFRNRIDILVGDVLSYKSQLKKVPITAYASVIDMDGQRGGQKSIVNRRLTEIYFPTLYDFVASQCLELLRSNGSIEAFLPWGLLTTHDNYVTFPFSKYDPTVGKILEIYASLLSFHDKGSAPYINADIERIEFISSHIYASSDDDARSLPERKYDLLRSMYEENGSSEYSGDILLAIPSTANNQKWLYKAVNHNIKTYPTYPRNNNLLNLRRSLEERVITLSYPDVAGPGVPVKLNVKAKNVRSGKIYIYNVSSSPITDRSYNCNGLPGITPTAILPFSIPTGNEIPFSTDISVDYSFPAVGNYIAIATIDGVTPTGRRWYDKINVTHYSLATSSFEKNTVWALDALTGAPIEGASISVNDSRRNSSKTLSPLGVTDKNGSLDVTARGNVFMTKNSDRFASPVWIYSPDKLSRESGWTRAASGYSSLPIYHPGDSVEWMAIVYEYKGKDHRPLISQEITAILRDANHQAIDTIKTTTDEFGRITGVFDIPKDCLTGRFCISVNSYSAPISFMVSDYKLPTFHVVLEPVEKDYPASGDVTLRGHVETYTGFPVGDAQLTLDIYASPRGRWWWQRQSKVKFQTLTGQTDAAGLIEFTIPKDLLNLSPIPDCVFHITVTALSPAGESQTASTVFSDGQRYVIRVSVPENIDITAPTELIKATVVNYQDSTVTIPIDFAVMRDSVSVLNGQISSASQRIDLSSIPSGKYEIRFSLPDPSIAEAVSQNVVLYRPTDKNTPVPGTLLWYPTDKIMTETDCSAKWLYAVDCPTNLLVTLHNGSEILSQKWVSAEAGMGCLPVSLPEGVEAATMHIAVTGKYRSSTASVNVVTNKTPVRLKFTTESFRDRIVPGSEETWTFRVTDMNDRPKKSAVVLDMYNTALDVLATSSWSFNPISEGARFYYSWDQPAMNMRGSMSVSYFPGKYLSTVSLVHPDFNTYGLSLLPNKLRIRGVRMMAKSAATANGSSDDFYNINEVAEEAEVEEVMNTVQLTSRAISSDTGGAALKAEYANADVAMDMDEVAGATTESGVADAQPSSENTFTFRDREVPLAFFRPMLTTDADGHLSFSFTVPNANTTWGFRALAFTDSLLSTSFSTDVLASKPVMVQPNLPRFVRAGDIVSIPASVMNNSDCEQSIETHVEIFNASDGKTVSEYNQKDIIAAGSSSVVSIKLEAPTDAPFIGYRVKSSTDRFADGEQALLPVLPAVTPVIDTYPFYMPPEENDFSMDLPKIPTGARVTLQFCENPTWYVVTALPGLLDVEASTANEAAASIFSAAIASGLIHDNPLIGQALKEWNESDHSDNTLTSMLKRNEDLKQILLASTPWMLDARNDNERMTRLALLFDKSTVNSTMKSNIAILKKLVRENGGWAWNSYGDKASQWATENVLLLLGHLRELGYLPDSSELTSMINSALRWIDTEARKSYQKNPDSDFTLYVYLRSRFKGMAGVPVPDSSIVNTTTQRILAKWKKASVFDKGIYAQILFHNSYKTVAKTIIESLREFSEYSPAKGMWWPALDDMTFWSMSKIGTTAMLLQTFATVDPGCQDIDRIRQWLILQKEAKDWGTSVTTSAAIAAILSTSTRWIEPAQNASISVAGKTIQPDKIERMTGYFRTSLPLNNKSKGKLKISRISDAPSWGTLYYLYSDSMTSIRPHKCPELSIEKRIAVNGKYTEDLTIGDKATVTLTIRVERDMDYVTVIDDRPACYEPVEQLPTPIFAEGICFYRENRDSSTRLFIDHLPKGTYIITYDMWVNNAGTFASGVATVQSQYAPQFTAHTAGGKLVIGN